MNDLRYALRQLLRRPAFSLIVVLTLALGIGANTAIFSVVQGVVLRPLPYDEPGQLVRMLGYHRDAGLDFGTISYPNFRDFQDQSRSFAAMAAYDEWRPTLRGDRPARLAGASVNANFFDVLGVRPGLGRFFRSEEDVPGAASAVVLGNDLWVERFGGDSTVIGRTIDLSGFPYTVIGVLPATFEDPGLSGSWGVPALWRATPTYFADASRGSRSYTAIARLASGVTRDAAEAELNTIMAGLTEAYPENNTNRAIALRSLTDDILGNASTPLWMLFAAVGVVLLVACGNVANLLMSRAAGRSREIAMRTALGASRWHIGRQLLVESLVLAGLGALLGGGIAALGADVLAGMAGDALPRGLEHPLNVRVLGFTAGVALFAGLLFGVAPVLEARRVQAGQALKEDERTTTSRKRTGRMQLLVGAQMALSLTLLVGASLLIRSLWNLANVDPGVDARGVLTVEVDASGLEYPEWDDVTALYDAILPRVAALPGVEEVGAIDILPLSGSFNGNSFTLSDRPEPPPGERWGAETRAATPAFFSTMRVPLVRGRLLAPSDREDAPKVVVVSQSFAERFFPGDDPLGVRVSLFGEEWEIVGVAANVHQFGLDEAPVPEIYTPHRQNPYNWMRRDMVLVVRGAGDVARLAGPIRQAVWSVAPSVAVENAVPMDEVVAGTMAAQRFRTLLFGLFAALAVVLGVVGIYGVVVYAVVQRTHEVGIRLALGARTGRLVQMLVFQGMRPVVLGGIAGLVGAVLAARGLQGLLFQVRPLDPFTFAGAVAVLAGAAAVACWLPARRAARIEPMEALRHE